MVKNAMEQYTFRELLIVYQNNCYIQKYKESDKILFFLSVHKMFRILSRTCNCIRETKTESLEHNILFDRQKEICDNVISRIREYFPYIDWTRVQKNTYVFSFNSPGKLKFNILSGIMQISHPESEISTIYIDFVFTDERAPILSVSPISLLGKDLVQRLEYGIVNILKEHRIIQTSDIVKRFDSKMNIMVPQISFKPPDILEKRQNVDYSQYYGSISCRPPPYAHLHSTESRDKLYRAESSSSCDSESQKTKYIDNGYTHVNYENVLTRKITPRISNPRIMEGFTVEKIPF